MRRAWLVDDIILEDVFGLQAIERQNVYVALEYDCVIKQSLEQSPLTQSPSLSPPALCGELP